MTAYDGTEAQARECVISIMKCCPELRLEAYNASTHRENWKMRLTTQYAVIEHLIPTEATWHTLHMMTSALAEAYLKGVVDGRRDGYRDIVANIIPGGMKAVIELEKEISKTKPG